MPRDDNSSLEDGPASKQRGFASMSPEQRSRIGRMGGQPSAPDRVVCP